MARCSDGSATRGLCFAPKRASRRDRAQHVRQHFERDVAIRAWCRARDTPRPCRRRRSAEGLRRGQMRAPGGSATVKIWPGGCGPGSVRSTGPGGASSEFGRSLDHGLALFMSVGRHQSLQFVEPVENDPDFLPRDRPGRIRRRHGNEADEFSIGCDVVTSHLRKRQTRFRDPVGELRCCAEPDWIGPDGNGNVWPGRGRDVEHFLSISRPDRMEVGRGLRQRIRRPGWK